MARRRKETAGGDKPRRVRLEVPPVVEPPRDPVWSSGSRMRLRLVEGLRLGMTIQDAAEYSGVSPADLMYRLRRGRSGLTPEDVELLDEVQSAQAQYSRAAMSSMVRSAGQGNPAAITAMAERADRQAAELGRLSQPPEPTEVELIEQRLEDVRARMGRSTPGELCKLIDKEAELVQRRVALRGSGEMDLSTPEGVTELEEALAAIPVQILQRAIERRQTVQPHLRIVEVDEETA